MDQVIDLNFRRNTLTYTYILETNSHMDLSSNGLGDLIGLKYLYLSNNNIYDNISSNVGNLLQLEMIYLSCNNLNRVIPSSLEYLLALTYFDVSFNNLMIPSQLVPINLKHLSICHYFYQGMMVFVGRSFNDHDMSYKY